jgi:hypothetical protein
MFDDFGCRYGVELALPRIRGISCWRAHCLE